MTRFHVLAKRFADGIPLTSKDLADGRDVGIFGTHGQNNGWALTEYGASLLPSMAQARPDDDSYWPPGKSTVYQPSQEALNLRVCQQLRFDPPQQGFQIPPVADSRVVGPGTCNPQHRVDTTLLDLHAREQLTHLANQDVLSALDVQPGGEHYFDRDRNRPATVEQDPLGKHQHETGAKLDAGKVRLGLVLGAFSNALVEVGKVGTYGAQKYTDNGWLDVPKGKARYTDALLRHIFAEASGEECDSDTGLSHLAHACWNMLAVLELHMRSKE